MNEQETIKKFHNLTVGELLGLTEHMDEYGPFLTRIVNDFFLLIYAVFRDDGLAEYGPDGLQRWAKEQQALQELKQQMRKDFGTAGLLVDRTK